MTTVAEDQGIADVIDAAMSKASEKLAETAAQRAHEIVSEKAKEQESTIEELRSQIKELQEAKKDQQAFNLSGLEVGRKCEKSKFSLGRFAMITLGLADRGDKDYGLEFEVLDQTTKSVMDRGRGLIPNDVSKLLLAHGSKAVNAGTDAAGGYLVPTEVQSEIVELLRDNMIAFQLGMRRRPGLVGNLSYRTNGGGITVGYVDSDALEAATKTDPTFGEFNLEPHVAMCAGDLSWSMQTQTDVAMESWFRDEYMAELGLFMDKKIFLGSGTDKEITGIFNRGDLTTATTWSGATYTGGSQTVGTKGRAMVGAIEDSKALKANSKIGWFGAPRVFRKIANCLDADGRPIFIKESDAGLNSMWLGYGIGKSVQLQASAAGTERIGVGDFNTAVHGEWGSMAFAASDQHDTNFLKGVKTIRGIFVHDLALTHPTAWNVATDFDAS